MPFLLGQGIGSQALVGGGNDFVITHAAAGLNHAGGACFGNYIQTITEGEESVGRNRRTLQGQASVFSLDGGDGRLRRSLSGYCTAALA